MICWCAAATSVPSQWPSGWKKQSTTALPSRDGRLIGRHCGPKLARNAAISAGTSASVRSEEHTSELQSLMRISYAVFCLKTKKKTQYKMYQKDSQT